MPLLIAALAFVAMEPVTALLHRVLFHGFGWVLHRSHHRVRSHGVEANDLYPVGIAAFTIALMAVGSFVDGASVRAVFVCRHLGARSDVARCPTAPAPSSRRLP